MNATEITAFLLSIAYVWLNARQNAWCWPIGGLSVALYGYLFFEGNLYADATLQIIYLGFSVYGWLNWKKLQQQPDTQPVISIINMPILLLLYLFATAILFGLTYVVLDKFAAATLREWDALTFSLSLLATYWSARKIIENWPLWIVTNAIYIGVYLYKDWQLTALLSLIMAVMAAWGWYKWRK